MVGLASHRIGFFQRMSGLGIVVRHVKIVAEVDQRIGDFGLASDFALEFDRLVAEVRGADKIALRTVHGCQVVEHECFAEFLLVRTRDPERILEDRFRGPEVAFGNEDVAQAVFHAGHADIVPDLAIDRQSLIGVGDGVFHVDEMGVGDGAAGVNAGDFGGWRIGCLEHRHRLAEDTDGLEHLALVLHGAGPRSAVVRG